MMCEITPAPSAAPSDMPSTVPSVAPTGAPSGGPSAVPTVSPSSSPTNLPSVSPTSLPTGAPSAAPTRNPAPPPLPPPPSPPDPPLPPICECEVFTNDITAEYLTINNWACANDVPNSAGEMRRVCYPSYNHATNTPGKKFVDTITGELRLNPINDKGRECDDDWILCQITGNTVAEKIQYNQCICDSYENGAVPGTSLLCVKTRIETGTPPHPRPTRAYLL